MSKDVILILAYYGNLPNYFPFWLKSCGDNSSFTWLLITDAEICAKIPANVLVKNMSFDALKKKIQGCFNFKISLDKPYKLCDYRPAFGAIFQEEISGYSYWGYCDMDLIWGDLGSLMNIIKSGVYDKILDLGHCTLLKNTPDLVTAFQAHFSDCLFYQDVYLSSRNMIFDEDGAGDNGFSTICKKLGMKIYSSRNSFADIKIRDFELSKLLYDEDKKIRYHEIYLKDEHGVTELYEDVQKNVHREAQWYVHFQKRCIYVETDHTDRYLLIPPGRLIDVPENFEQKLTFLAPRNLTSVCWNMKTLLRRVPRLIRMKACHAGKILLSKLKRNS